MPAPVSIIVPWWINSDNEERQLRICGKTLECVRKFTKMDYNLVVVDNNSTERGSKLALSFDPEYYIKLPINSGMIHAINAGVRASFSKYVYYINADNMPSQGVVEKLYQYLVDHPEIEHIGGPLTEHVNKNYEYTWPNKPNPGDSIYDLFDRDRTCSFSVEDFNNHAQTFNTKNDEFKEGVFAGQWMTTRNFYEEMNYLPVNTNEGKTWMDGDNVIYTYLDMKRKRYGTHMGALLFHPDGGRTNSNACPSVLEPDRRAIIEKLGTRVFDRITDKGWVDHDGY